MSLPSPSLRIALISDWFHPRVGGIEVHLQGLATALARAGHDPQIITATPGPISGYGFAVHRLAVPITERFGFVHTPAPFLKIRALLAEGRFDVVHGHSSILSPLVYGALWLAKRQGLAAVMTCHSVIQYYDPLFWLADRLMGWSRWPVLFSSVSPTAARFLARAGRMDQVHILPNAVDAGCWRLPSAEKDPDEIRLVSVMRLSVRKRARALISLLPDLLRRLPPPKRLHLTIVGDGNQRPRLERLIQELDLEKVVTLTGILDQPAIASLFARSDLFVMPATHEAFGIAALEARAAGLPVVGMARSGLSHLIRDGEEGLLAESDEELRDHLLALSADEPRRRALAAHNRATEPAWTWEAAIARHLELYALARQMRDCYDEKRGGREGGR